MPPPRALLVDALGTLLELEPPWLHLSAALPELPRERLAAAFRAEMRYYRAHADEGRDPESLAELRRRCAAVLSRELGVEVEVDTMMDAIRFRPYPDAVPALRAARERGLRAVCVSNWDCSLPQVLSRCGLTELLHGVVPSALAGARKPSPEIFERALSVAGCGPAEAVHVGDSPDEDVAGARAAGVAPVLIDRGGEPTPDLGGGDVPRIASLVEIDQYLRP